VAALGPPESLAKDSRPTFDAYIWRPQGLHALVNLLDFAHPALLIQKSIEDIEEQCST
jgi:hypothetical protein